MSQQREFDEVSAERLAICHRILAEMIFHGVSEQTIRDAASEFGVAQEQVDKLWQTIIGVAA